MSNNYSEIKDKLDQELNDLLEDRRTFQKSKAVAPLVVEALIEFSRNDKFARTLISSTHSLTECCNSIMKGAKAHISDNEVFAKAAEYYMPGAVVNIIMEIRTGKPTVQDNINFIAKPVVNTEKKRKRIEISLDDLL